MKKPAPKKPIFAIPSKAKPALTIAALLAVLLPHAALIIITGCSGTTSLFWSLSDLELVSAILVSLIAITTLLALLFYVRKKPRPAISLIAAARIFCVINFVCYVLMFVDTSQAYTMDVASLGLWFALGSLASFLLLWAAGRHIYYTNQPKKKTEK